ncbi:MAG: AraC family transcriptional regulator [Bryobacterales bacterium]|nr:AraC family transcriptional regulator [Bryobacterales bacterium]
MAKPVPIYKALHQSYKADSCQPLTEAVAAGEIRLEALVHGHYPGQKLPPATLQGLKTVGYWDADREQAWGLPWHRNEGIEITYLERGHLGFHLDGHAFPLQPGDLTVTRPWQRHRVGNPNVGAGRLHWLIMDVGVRRPNQTWRWPAWLLLSRADLHELTSVLRQNEQPVWKAGSEIRRCFQGIARTVATDERGSSVSRLAVSVNELFVLLLELVRRHDVVLDESLTSSRRTVELLLADLRVHPEHLQQKWNVHDMARSCGLGVTQFIHHVRLLTNLTPAQYIQACRLDHAASLLRSETVSVTAVSLECGFSSSQYFATSFQQRFGCTPREYRRRPPAATRKG